MFYSLYDFWNSIFNVIKSITFVDVLDMIIVALICSKLINLVRETRAGQLVRGIMLFIGVYVVSSLVGLKVMTFLLKNMLDIGLLAILIMFQPELRRMLEKVGRSANVTLFNFNDVTDEQIIKWNKAIDSICESCEELSLTYTGALIVVERQTKLGEQIDTGVMIHGEPSKELFGNIFYPKTPLHDGAVIIRDGEVLAAACFLPKPQKEEFINKKLGSRHRAAIGMSENSDAVVIVVSEETGTISVAENGDIIRNFTKQKLRELLQERVIPHQNDIKTNPAKKIRDSIRQKKDKQ